MESELSIFEILAFIFFVGLSAFFSAAETAFMTLFQNGQIEANEKAARYPRSVHVLQSRVQELLIAILIGNTLANISAATIAALLATRIAAMLQVSSDLALMVEVFAVTLILLLLSEITPKTLALRHAGRFARTFGGLMVVFFYIFKPLTAVLNALTTGLADRLEIAKRGYFFKEEELRTLIEVGQEQGALQEEEREMIHSIFEFRKTQVKEVMVPRIDMVCIEKDATLEELITLIHQKGHSRIPLYEGSVDKILGIIHAKDLLPYLNDKGKKIDLANLARKTLYVPEYKRIDELLREFQREKIHMAIVVDEYGGTAGLVTLEDILEEIVGEIQDEYDQETPLFRRIKDDTYVVNAKIDLHDLNDELDMDLPTEEDYESLGGFIFSLTGKVPEEKQTIFYKNYEFVIEKVERNRILQVKIRKRSDASEKQSIEVENE
ncbi:MAG: hemolysin family protein [candidate division KSB1 bacterium]|nr:hemolysin family protein [candidate division KSB1 bacterium]